MLHYKRYHRTSRENRDCEFALSRSMQECVEDRGGLNWLHLASVMLVAVTGHIVLAAGDRALHLQWVTESGTGDVLFRFS